VQSIGAASHPSSPVCGSYDDWTANGIKGRRQDADWAFPEPGPILAMSPAVAAALSWFRAAGIWLKSQDYSEILEILFFPL
jgi:hypothetical protein